MLAHFGEGIDNRKTQIPPDLVVKSQTIDITGGVLSLIRRPKGVQTLHRNRKSRLELLFLSEAHRSTTKSDGMWKSQHISSMLEVQTYCSLRGVLN
jgi:hypothetical protein